MYYYLRLILLLFAAFISADAFSWSHRMSLPTGFVYLENIDPTIIQDMKYFTHHNFIGRPIKGYEAKKCIISAKAAQALSTIQQKLLAQSLSLKVFDCYRPQMAVQDFITWSEDVHDQKMKLDYYPRVDKADFFNLGYVSKKSGHTRGSTVDLTVVHLFSDERKPVEFDMGTHFDFMDELSHTFSSAISSDAKKNRLFLRKLMEEVGFQPYDKEWWHFTLKDEPFPDTYFDFPIKPIT